MALKSHGFCSGCVLLAAIGLLGCKSEPPAPSVISLIDQIEPGETAESFRVLVAESRPAAFLLAGSGLSLRMGDRSFDPRTNGTELRKIMEKGVTEGIMTQSDGISTIRFKCGIRRTEKVFLRIQYRKPGNVGCAVSCEFVQNPESSEPIILDRNGNHVEANLDPPPEGADGIVIRHELKPGEVLDLTSVIILGVPSPIGRSVRYRIRAFFDRVSGPDAFRRGTDPGNVRTRVNRDGEIRDCIRLERGSRVMFALPHDMDSRGLRFSLLPLSGKTIGTGVFLFSFMVQDTWKSIEREIPEGVSKRQRWELIIDPSDIPSGCDSVRIVLRKHETGVYISEPVAILKGGMPRTNPRNIVLIALDTVRADRLGTYGYDTRPTTERLDAVLRKRGFFVFDHAYSPSPWTLPATAKIFASRYLDFHTGSSVPDQYTLLAETLRAGGYYCAGFTGGGQLALPGFEQGFHEYHYSKNLGKVEDSFPQAEAWLESWDAGSFFLFLHTYEPHWPYIRDHFCENLPRGRLRNLGRSGRPFPRGVDVCTALTKEESLFVQAAYDSGIRHASDAVVDFLELFDGKDLWRNTVVVILSDHGEEFWEHFPVFASHAHSLYNELLHVPLMIYDPGRAERGISHIHQSVTTVDVVPTIHDLLGLTGDTAMTAMDGISLSPYLDDQTLHGQRSMLAAVKSPGLPKICIVDNGKKLIKPFGHGRHTIEECKLYPEKIEVYDLENDPLEQYDLTEKNPALRKALLSKLDRVKRSSQEPFKKVSPPVHEPSEELKLQLKRLGYME